MKSKAVCAALVAACCLLATGCGEEQTSPREGIVSQNGNYYYYENGQIKKDCYATEGDADSDLYYLYYFTRSTGMGTRFKVGKVTDNITAVVEQSSPIIYVVEGDERALVIDSGSGVGDFGSIVSHITDKPYSLALTHGHGDHIGGAFAAECDVYLNEADHDMAAADTVEMRHNYVLGQRVTCVALEDMAPSINDRTFLPLNQGDSFDLGGYTVSAYSLPGHTAGSMALLCEEDRLLITGDAANGATGLANEDGISVQSYCEHLKALKEHEAAWDAILTSHVIYSTFKKSMIDDLISLCEEIMQKGYSDGEMEMDAELGAYRTQRSGYTGQFTYYKSRIYKG